MGRRNIKVESEYDEVVKNFEKRDDFEAARMRRFMAMPDLSRKEGSPIKEMVDRIVNQDNFKDLDIIECPEVVSTHVAFDLFDFPKDHVARSKSDTYFLDDEHILRPHTTTMWYYYLQDEEVKKRMENNEPVGCFSHGKVYRKDEIDRNHMNVFHQIDGWYLIPKDQKTLKEEDLKEILKSVVTAVFGDDVNYKFAVDTFPYTDPSLEMEVEVNGRWIEIFGSGVVKGSVLEAFGVDSNKWNGWAFGFGLERLAIISMDLPDIRLIWSDDERVAKQLKLGQKYQEVSKYPPITRDISFIVSNDFIPNDYFELIRDIGGDLVEEVELLDKYENEEKFGKDKVSYTYRVVYRSLDKTLTDDEINPIQQKLYDETSKVYSAELR